MFRPSSEALLLTEAGIQGLCPSLNAPVLNVDELPVGPARAAIILFAEQYGGLSLAVGVRSIESGAVVLYRYSKDVSSRQPKDRAMDAALSFAEGMGFLFDDDMVGRAGRGDALAHWHALLGEAGGVEAVAELAALPLDDDHPELLLDEDEEPALDVDLEIEEPPAGIAEAQPGSAAGVSLTKFRTADAAAEDDGASPSGNQLGRIPLVRRRLDDAEGAARSDPLLRLLGSF